MPLSNTGTDRFLAQNYYSKSQLNSGQLDTRYFAESEHINTSAGAGDAGKPIKLNASGKIDATMITDSDIDHGSTGGLSDDDHAQYVLLAGRSGGQSLTGGTASGNGLTLLSTSHATKGKITLGTTAAFDQATGNFGIGTTAPTLGTLQVTGNLGGAGTAGLYLDPVAAGTGTQYGIRIVGNGTGATDFIGFGIHGGTLTNWKSSLWIGDDGSRPGINCGYASSVAAPTRGAIIEGNVGIGTSSPSTKLHVSGTIATTDATVNGTATVTTLAATNATVGGAAVTTASNTQTLTNKTLTSPTLTTPTISSTGFANANHAHQGSTSGGQLDHGLALTGLTDDDHSQYALLAGRSGGQSLTGGTAANDDLTIQGTSNATRTSSYVILQPTGGNVAVGGTTTDWKMEVAEGNFRIAFNPGFGSATNYISSYNSAVGVQTAAPLSLFGSRVSIDSGIFNINTGNAPASAAASGTAGDFAWDTNYLYQCVATNTWKRAALSTW